MYKQEDELLTPAVFLICREYSRHHCDRTDLKQGKDELVKMNKIPATTKLEWALQMAESVALLHNHWRGVIVHDDVQPFQWLITEDGNIKMNGRRFLLLGVAVCRTL